MISDVGSPQEMEGGGSGNLKDAKAGNRGEEHLNVATNLHYTNTLH